MKKIIMMIVVGLFMVGAVSTAQAVVLMPGALNVAPTGAMSPGGSLLTSIVDTFSGTDANNVVYYTGTLTQTVRSNSTGLLFEYSFLNDITSRNAITQLASLDFSNYSISADALRDAGSVPGSPSVNGMNRSGDQGVVVTFGWLDSPVAPGQSSGSFWIQTDAESYTNGTTQLIGGGISTSRTYGPTSRSATPEPATVSLLGMGLMGLLGLQRKRSV